VTEEYGREPLLASRKDVRGVALFTGAAADGHRLLEHRSADEGIGIVPTTRSASSRSSSGSNPGTSTPAPVSAWASGGSSSATAARSGSNPSPAKHRPSCSPYRPQTGIPATKTESGRRSSRKGGPTVVRSKRLEPSTGSRPGTGGIFEYRRGETSPGGQHALPESGLETPFRVAPDENHSAPARSALSPRHVLLRVRFALTDHRGETMLQLKVLDLDATRGQRLIRCLWK
jgi:hypothetical protein